MPNGNCGTGRTYVKSRRVKAGGYCRSVPKGAGLGQDEKLFIDKGRVVRSAALLFGGAIAGGSLGALASTWIAKNGIEKKVNEARQSAKAEHENDIQKIEREYEEKLKNSVDSVKRSFDLQVEEAVADRKNSLEIEYGKRIRKARQDLQSELVERIKDAESRANEKALRRIEAERVAAKKMAQDEIDFATSPKPPANGEIAEDEVSGISLAASVRAGLDLNVSDPENTLRRLESATRRMVSRQVAQAMSAMDSDFRERMQEIHKMHTSRPPRGRKEAENQMNIRWEAMNTALTRQGQREARLLTDSEDLHQELRERYSKLYEDLQLKAQGRGSYDADLIAEFDTRSQEVNSAFLVEMQKISDRVRRQERLDRPFTGRSDSVESRSYRASFGFYARTDASGRRCGKGFISPGKECRLKAVSSALNTQSNVSQERRERLTRIATLLGEGVVKGAGTTAGAAIGAAAIQKIKNSAEKRSKRIQSKLEMPRKGDEK